MHYLVITDGRGEHVLFKGTRDTLDQIAAKMRRDTPALRVRVTGDAVNVPVRRYRKPVRAEDQRSAAVPLCHAIAPIPRPGTPLAHPRSALI